MQQDRAIRYMHLEAKSKGFKEKIEQDRQEAIKQKAQQKDIRAEAAHRKAKEEELRIAARKLEQVTVVAYHSCGLEIGEIYVILDVQHVFSMPSEHICIAGSPLFEPSVSHGFDLFAFSSKEYASRDKETGA